MIACRVGSDSFLLLFFSESADGIVGTPRLERSAFLQVLAFEEDFDLASLATIEPGTKHLVDGCGA